MHGNESDPFAHSRRQDGVLVGDFDGERIPMLLRHKNVRAASRDFATFSSDAPCRVPIPSEETVRSVRQLPIETDPPTHTRYRAIVAPLFLRAARADYKAEIDRLVTRAFAELQTGEPVEVVARFSLPLQSRALALLLSVPETEAETWIEWGNHAFRDNAGLNPHKGRAVDRYIDDALGRADALGEGNLFRLLLNTEYEGRRLTRDEAHGFANLAFAGGRDTVINSLTGALLYMAEHPEARHRINDNPRLIASATEELVRWLSPITHLGRVCPSGAHLGPVEVAPGQRVALCWASANRDETVFDRPHEVILDRNPNPHLAFGSGPHTCLGAAHARALLRSLLQLLAKPDLRIEVLDKVPAIKRWPHYTRQVGYERAMVRITR